MKIFNTEAWSYYVQFYQGKYSRVVAVMALSIVQSMMVFPMVFLAKLIVDEVVPEGQTSRLFEIGSIFLTLIIVSGAILYITKSIALKLNAEVIKSLRFDLIARYYSLPLSSIVKIDKGKYHTVFLADVGRVESMGNLLISTLLSSVFATVVLSGVLLYLNWKLFLVLLVLLPILVYTTQRMGLGIKSKVDTLRKSFQDLSKRMHFVLWMAELTKLQTAEDYEFEKQRKGLECYHGLAVALELKQTAYGIVQRSFSGLMGVVVLVVGGLAVISDSMSLGDLISFYIAARLLQGYANPLLSALPAVIAGNEALVEISEIIELKDRNPYLGHREINFKGSIALRDVTFGYDSETIIEKTSMDIPSGSTVALLGPNGSGKSTITNLILGFYRPCEGELFADGIPFQELSLIEIRKSIGVVPQSPIFFKGTIYENIVYGFPEANREEVEKASMQAGAHGFIVALPDGYETSLADAGALISGGERQLIAIARALLRSPRLLILDEPTNHLSKEAIEKLLLGFKQDRNTRTTLIISHSWEIAHDADSIYYLESGKIRQVSYDELSDLELRQPNDT